MFPHDFSGRPLDVMTAAARFLSHRTCNPSPSSGLDGSLKGSIHVAPGACLAY